MPASKDPTAPFIDAWIKEESGGNTKALNKKSGARGLLQIMPATARDYGITNPDLLFNPTVNMAVAKRYLNDLTKKYNGNTTLALMAYNDGPGNIDKWLAGKRELPTETKRYVVNILKGGQAAMQVPPAMLDSGTRAAAKPSNALEIPSAVPAAAAQVARAASSIPSAAASDQPIPSAPQAPTQVAGGGFGPPGRPWQARQADEESRMMALSRMQQVPPPTPQQPLAPPGPMPSIAPSPPPGILQRLGIEGTAEAADPDEYTGPVLDKPPKMSPPSMAVPPPAAAGVPMPTPSPTAAPLPDEYAGPVLDAPPKKPEPLLAKIADWFPAAGQFGGELLGGAIGAPAAGAEAATGIGIPLAVGQEMLAVGGGGAIGAGGGEAIKEGVYKYEGLPYTEQIGTQAAIGGVTSALGVPAGKAVSKLVPGLRAARGAVKEYGAAKAASKAAEGEIAATVKMTPAEAAVLEPGQQARKGAVKALIDISQSVRDRLGQGYDWIKSSWGHRVTPGEGPKAFWRLPVPTRKEVIGEANRVLDPKRLNPQAIASWFRYPTVARSLEMRSAMRSVRSAMNQETERAARAQLGHAIDTVTGDIEKALPNLNVVKGLRDLDRLYFEHNQVEFPHAVMQGIRKARSIVEVGNLAKKEATLNNLLREVERIPDKIHREMSFRGVKDSISSALHAAAATGSTMAARLSHYKNFIATIPEAAWKELYGTEREAVLATIRNTEALHGRMLRFPELRTAVDVALQQFVKGGGGLKSMVMHHLVWVGMGGVLGAAGGYSHGGVEEAVGFGILGLLGAGMIDKIARSDVALKYYGKAVLEKSPHLIAKGMRDAVAALVTQTLRYEDPTADASR